MKHRHSCIHLLARIEIKELTVSPEKLRKTYYQAIELETESHTRGDLCVRLQKAILGHPNCPDDVWWKYVYRWPDAAIQNPMLDLWVLEGKILQTIVMRNGPFGETRSSFLNCVQQFDTIAIAFYNAGNEEKARFWFRRWMQTFPVLYPDLYKKRYKRYHLFSKRWDRRWDGTSTRRFHA